MLFAFLGAGSVQGQRSGPELWPIVEIAYWIGKADGYSPDEPEMKESKIIWQAVQGNRLIVMNGIFV